MPSASAFTREILPAVSRTFALGIRVLPRDLGNVVRTAYLICRIADTIEDEPTLSVERKAELFDALSRCFDSANAATEFTARTGAITGDPAHVTLARHADLVFETYRELTQRSRASVRHWVGEKIAGMRKFLLAYPTGVRIQSLQEYREYCYYVAGTIGHLLTDLWHEHSSSIGATTYYALRGRCRAFAEVLQTVNILKDVARDAEHENSIYVPRDLLRAHVVRVRDPARPDAISRGVDAGAGREDLARGGKVADGAEYLGSPEQSNAVGSRQTCEHATSGAWNLNGGF